MNIPQNSQRQLSHRTSGNKYATEQWGIKTTQDSNRHKTVRDKYATRGWGTNIPQTLRDNYTFLGQMYHEALESK